MTRTFPLGVAIAALGLLAPGVPAASADSVTEPRCEFSMHRHPDSTRSTLVVAGSYVTDGVATGIYCFAYDHRTGDLVHRGAVVAPGPAATYAGVTAVTNAMLLRICAMGVEQDVFGVFTETPMNCTTP